MVDAIAASGGWYCQVRTFRPIGLSRVWAPSATLWSACVAERGHRKWRLPEDDAAGEGGDLMRRVLLTISGAMPLTMALAGSTFASGFQNGGFEDGGYVANGGAPLSFMTLPAGATTITGWVVGGEGIDWKETKFLTPAEGDKSIDLNHIAPGSIRQTFDTTINDTYVVRFMFAGIPIINATDCPAQYRVKEMTVAATGGATQTYAFDTTGYSLTNMGWRGESYSFKATGWSTTLTFTSISTTFCGPAIDQVELATVRVATASDCKKSGWKSMVDNSGTPFASQSLCQKFYR
jgi:choice-of-anchor C domain-containing protein